MLLAMGLGMDEAIGSLRLTIGYDTTDDDLALARAILSSVLAPTTARA